MRQITDLEKLSFFRRKEYVSLYLNDGESVFEFDFVEGDQYFYHVAIKKPILEVDGQLVEEKYYDLETPYGYGGYLTNSVDKVFLKKAIEKYKEKCLSESIIAEFLRFDPDNSFLPNFQSFMQICVQERTVVEVDLNRSYDEIFKEINPKLGRVIRKGIKNGVEVIINDCSPKNQEIFRELYYQTMKKNRADKFYFFDKAYFERMFQLKGLKLYTAIYKGTIIGGITILEDEDKLYYHLGATSPEYYHLNPNTLLLVEVIKQYAEKKKGFVLGGGTSPDPEDPLFKFKKKFGRILKPFFIGGNIFNQQIYNSLCEMLGEEKQKLKYILKYRF